MDCDQSKEKEPAEEGLMVKEEDCHKLEEKAFDDEDDPIMNKKVVLPPPSSWFLSRVAVVKDENIWAYIAMSSIVVVKQVNEEVFLEKKSDDRLSLALAGEELFKPKLRETWPEFVLLGNQKEKFNSLSFCPIDDKDKDGDKILLPVPNNSLASGCGGGIVRIWDIDRATTLVLHKAHKEKAVIGVDWSKLEPQLIYSIDECCILAIWDVKRKDIRMLEFGPTFQPNAMSVSLVISNQVAIGMKSGIILIVNTSGAGIITTKIRHDDEIISLLWMPKEYLDDSSAVISSKNEVLLSSSVTTKSPSIRIWDSKGNDLQFYSLWSKKDNNRFYMKSFNPACWSKDLSCPNDVNFITCGRYGEIISWKFGDQDQSSSKEIHNLHRSNMIFGVIRSGDILWSFSNEPVIIGWNLRKNKLHCAIPTVRGISIIAPSPLGNYQMLLAGTDSVLRILNMTKGYPLIDSKVPKLSTKVGGKITAVSWHPSEEFRVAFGTDEGLVGVYEWAGGTQHREPFRFDRRLSGTVYTITWAPKISEISDKSLVENGNDGEVGDETPKKKRKNHFVLYACAGYSLWVFNPSNSLNTPLNLMKLLGELNQTEGKMTRPGKVTEFAFTPDYSYLAIGYDEGLVELYSCKTLKLRCIIHCHFRGIQYLLWRPYDFEIEDENVDEEKPKTDNKKYNYLATASNDGFVKLFDLNQIFLPEFEEDVESEPLVLISSNSTLNGHGGVRVISLAWSPHNENLLASASYDRGAIIWDITKDEPIARYSQHLHRLVAICFHPNDIYKVISSSDEHFFDFTAHVWDYRAHPYVPGPLKQFQCPSMTREETELEIVNVEVGRGSLNSSFKKQLVLNEQDKKSEASQQAPQVKEVTAIRNSQPAALNKKAKKVYALLPLTSSAFFSSKPSLLVHEVKYLVDKTPLPHLNNKDADDDIKSVATLMPIPSNEQNGQDSKIEDGQELVEELAVVDSKESSRELALSIFGEEEDCRNMLKCEMNDAIKVGKWTNALVLGQCQYEPQVAIYEAIKQGEVTELMISVARLSSRELMIETIKAYVSQLNDKDELLKGVSYLLIIDEFEKAVELLMKNKKYREAMAVAKCNFLQDSEIMKKLESEWAYTLIKEGNIEVATKLLAATGKIEEAIQALEKRNYPAAWITALYLSSKLGNDENFLKYGLFIAERATESGKLDELLNALDEYPVLKRLIKLQSTSNQNQLQTWNNLKRELETETLQDVESKDSVCDETGRVFP